VRSFLTHITKGAYTTDIEKEHRLLLKRLLQEQIVKKTGKRVRLNSKYRAGVVELLPSGVAFLKPIDAKGKELFIESKNLSDAKNGDYVIVRRLFGKHKRPSAKVVIVVQPVLIYTVGYIKHTKLGIQPLHIKTDLPMELKNSIKELSEYIVFQVDNRTSKITQILGNLNDPKVDEKISLAIFNKQEHFSKEAKTEALSWANSGIDTSLYPNHKDLRKLPFCTIDPVDAKDFDDAIYWDEKNHTLYVAIADVSSYVTPNSALDKEAKNRGVSIYFPHKSIPMLPRALSEDICSLKPNVDRLAYVCRLEIDTKRLTVRKHTFFEAIIRSKRRYSYDEVDAYFKSGLESAKDDDKRTLSFIFSLKKITDKLRTKRLKKGYDFRSTEIKMVLDDNHNLISTSLKSSTPSHRLIEDCMLLVNKAAAKHFEYGIFRTHKPPNLDKIEKLVDELGKIGIIIDESKDDFHSLVLALQKKAKEKGVEAYVDRLIIQTQKQANYTAKSVGHFGLGFEQYTHFTSPIRRYSDLILHRLLKAIFSNNKKIKEYILRNIEPLCVKVSELEREAVKVEWDFTARKYARWAHTNRCATLKAVVTDTAQTPIATTDEGILGMRVFCNKNDLLLFDRIEAKIDTVHLAQAKIFVNAESSKHLFNGDK